MPEWARSSGPGLVFVVVEAVTGPGGIRAKGQYKGAKREEIRHSTGSTLTPSASWSPRKAGQVATRRRTRMRLPRRRPRMGCWISEAASTTTCYFSKRSHLTIWPWNRMHVGFSRVENIFLIKSQMDVQEKRMSNDIIHVSPGSFLKSIAHESKC